MVGDYLAPRRLRGRRRAGSLAAGRERLRGGGYDALLLDLMLPDGDGLELCRELRATRAPAQLPLLMLTARGEPMDRIVGLELGADDYLPKPFEPRELLARVKALLRRACAAAGRPTRCCASAAWRSTSARAQARLDGKPCELTSHQFDLLVVLAQSPGRVLSRDQIMDALKGHPLEAFDRWIDVHISRIRAAIEDDPKAPRRVLTVRGAGYVFARKQDADDDRAAAAARMRRLYLRIYLTVVVVLLLFALVSGWLVQRHLDAGARAHESARSERLGAWAELLQRSLPAPTRRRASRRRRCATGRSACACRWRWTTPPGSASAPPSRSPRRESRRRAARLRRCGWTTGARCGSCAPGAVPRARRGRRRERAGGARGPARAAAAGRWLPPGVPRGAGLVVIAAGGAVRRRRRRRLAGGAPADAPARGAEARRRALRRRRAGPARGR